MNGMELGFGWHLMYYRHRLYSMNGKSMNILIVIFETIIDSI